MTAAIIVAAGRGIRFGGSKQFSDLKGKPILQWSLDAFSMSPLIDHILLVVPEEEVDASTSRWTHQDKLHAVVAGGRTRSHSVANALKRLPEGAVKVLIHDGARPFVSQQLIQSICAKLAEFPAVIPVLPLTDTIKVVHGSVIHETLDREILRAVQTPQGFQKNALLAGYARMDLGEPGATDDASLLELAGFQVTTVDGDVNNIKITLRRDLLIAEAIVNGDMCGLE